jgi:hypothetical protein
MVNNNVVNPIFFSNNLILFKTKREFYLILSFKIDLNYLAQSIFLKRKRFLLLITIQ